jgi:transposase-like protein
MDAMSIPVAVLKHRGKCPACGKKGLGVASHPHAFGYKDYDRFACRYCKKTFKRKEKPCEPPKKTPSAAA